MKLERCRDQTRATLDEFYETIAAHDEPSDKTYGAAMLALIARLRALDNSREVWGLTSLYRLCLLAENTWRSPWYVIVVATGAHSYALERLVDGDELARVEVSSLDDAVAEVLRAMELSRGWPNSDTAHP